MQTSAARYQSASAACGCGCDPLHALGHAELSRELGQPVHLCRAVLSTRTANDREAGAVVVERGEATQCQVDTLERLDPADEEHERRLGQAQALSRFVRVAGREDRVIDAGRDDLDTIGIGAVFGDQLGALVRRRRHDPIGARDDLALDNDAFGRIVFEARGPFGVRERVKGRDERQIELMLELMADVTREPVVRVERVERPCGREMATRGFDEVADEAAQRFLRQRRRTPSAKVDDTKAGLDVDDLGLIRAIGAGEHVTLDTGACQR